VPYHQPVVSTTAGEVVGLEALVRWEHPTRGVLASGAFIEVALETAEQLAALAVVGCDASQGFSSPVPSRAGRVGPRPPGADRRAPSPGPRRGRAVTAQLLRRRARRTRPASPTSRPPSAAAMTRASTSGACTSAKTRLISTVWVL
jgi:hypothetical protein